MSVKEKSPHRRRLIAIATATAVVAGSAFGANAAFALPGANADDPSAAQAQILGVDAGLLNGVSVAALGHTFTSNPSAVGPEPGQLDVAVLDGLLDLNLGSLALPLISNGTNDGLLDLGDLGAAASYSSSPSLTQSIAASGLITADGAIDTGAIDGSTDPAYLELTDLLSQLGVAGLTDEIIDQAGVQIGALAARAENSAGVVDSSYAIGDLTLNLRSPLVGTLSSTLGTAIQGTVTPVSDLLAPGGALNDLTSSISGLLDGLNVLVANVETTGVEATITGIDTVGATVVTELLTQPVENATGSVLIDLATGTITVDLAKILVESGVGADLNSLPANTPVLSAETIAAIQQGITSALTGTHENSLVGKTSTILTTTLDSLGVSLKVNLDLNVVLVGTVASGDVTVAGTLAQFAGTDPTQPTVTPNVELLGLDLSLLTQPVVDLLTDTLATVTAPLVATALDEVIPLVQPALAAVTTPLLNTLDPILTGVLGEIVAITINEQPTEDPINGEGDLGAGSFTVRALSVSLLPDADAVNVDLASATVKAAAEAPVLDASSPVEAGASTTVTSSGWGPNSEVTLQLTDAAGDPVGDPITVTTNADGEFPAGTTLTVPAGTTPGEYTVVGEDAAGNTAEDTITVEEAAVFTPTLDASSPVAVGGDTTVTSEGWPPNTEVTLQLTDAAGDPVGDPITVTTNADGEFPAGTTLTVPVGTTPGDFTVVGEDADGNTAEDIITVEAAADANVNASASAAASANADDDNNASAQAAAQVAADADANTTASAAADATAAAAAQSAADEDASTDASTTATAAANASAAAAAQAAANTAADSDSEASASAAANADASAAAAVAANATSSDDASATAAADADAGADPDADAAADVNVNAAASASASANADDDSNASAAVAAQAAADADASTTASAAADANAAAAAQAAATATASADASTDATTDANASAAVAAQAAAQADASDDTNAAASVAADANAAAASDAASTATSSATASATAAADADADPAAAATTDADAAADVNVNAAASASASANADDDSNASAAVAAQAAADTDASTTVSAAADANAAAAAQAAATATASADASTDATTDANASAAVAAQASAQADNSSNTDAAATAAADANATAAADAASTATSSAAASADADADGGLATTGGEPAMGWLALGALLLMLGLGAALVARAKRVGSIAE